MSQLGTDGDDLITANETTVYALDGKDIIFTSLEFTNIYGGEGADFIQNEGEGISYLYGGGSGDTLAGGTVSDYLFGNDGDDLIVGGEFDYLTFLNTGNLVPYNNEVSGSDTLYGDTGNDALYGFDGDDFLYGGDGDDSETISVIDFTGSYVQVAAGLYGAMVLITSMVVAATITWTAVLTATYLLVEKEAIRCWVAPDPTAWKVVEATTSNTWTTLVTLLEKFRALGTIKCLLRSPTPQPQPTLRKLSLRVRQQSTLQAIVKAIPLQATPVPIACWVKTGQTR